MGRIQISPPGQISEVFLSLWRHLLPIKSFNHKSVHVQFKSAGLLFSWFLSFSWLSDGQFCRVLDDSENFVECACSHLSIYTASAEIDTLSSYNEAFYAAGFICISGSSLVSFTSVFSDKDCKSALLQMCCVSFRRLCLGHHISCALLQIPHVCCQTAHTHDGGLLRDTGRTSSK